MSKQSGSLASVWDTPLDIQWRFCLGRRNRGSRLRQYRAVSSFRSIGAFPLSIGLSLSLFLSLSYSLLSLTLSLSVSLTLSLSLSISSSLSLAVSLFPSSPPLSPSITRSSSCLSDCFDHSTLWSSVPKRKRGESRSHPKFTPKTCRKCLRAHVISMTTCVVVEAEMEDINWTSKCIHRKPINTD